MDEQGLTGAALARRVPCDSAYVSRLASASPARTRGLTSRHDLADLPDLKHGQVRQV